MDKSSPRDSIIELRFNGPYTQSIQSQLTSIIYENPLTDILKILIIKSFIKALVEVRHALQFLIVSLEIGIHDRPNFNTFYITMYPSKQWSK